MLDAQTQPLQHLQQGLDAITAFLDQPLCQDLAALHANDFVTVNPDSTIGLNEKTGSPWQCLPQDWQDWIVRQEMGLQEERDSILRCFALNDAADLVCSLRPSSIR